MDQFEQYSKPPLTEALLDIQVELPSGFSASTFTSCQQAVAADYPTTMPITQARGLIEIGTELKVSSATTSEYGYRFESADKLQLFQARLDGFTHNRLAPYNGWELFRSEARRLWSIYREVAKPTSIKRMAVRYINRIDFPGPRVDYKDYLRTSPEVSPALPQGVIGFFMQVTIPFPDIEACVNLSETSVDPPGPNLVSVVFDLDLYRSNELPNDEETLWNLFEAFRERKNEIFEACITDKTRELIR